MNRDPLRALGQQLEAKQTLLNQIRALATDDPDFFTDLLEGETNLLELIAALVDDEPLVDGAKAALDKLQAANRGEPHRAQAPALRPPSRSASTSCAHRPRRSPSQK